MMFPDSVSAFGRVYIPKPNYLRFVWDDENPDYDFKSRTVGDEWGGEPGDNPPAVMEYYSIRDERDRQRINLESDSSWKWRETIIAINGGDVRKFDYLVGEHRAQFNDTGWPNMAYVGMSGNVVEVIETAPGWVRFRTLKPTDWLAARSMTKVTHKHLIHHFTCITWKDGATKRIDSTGTERGEVLYPLVTWAGSAWIPARHVKPI